MRSVAVALGVLACGACGGDDGGGSDLTEDPVLGVLLGTGVTRYAVGVAPDGVVVEVGAPEEATYTWLPATGDPRRLPGHGDEEPILGWGTSLVPSSVVGLRRSEGTALEIVVLDVGGAWTSWPLPFNVLSVEPADVILGANGGVLLLDSLIGPQRCTSDGCQTAWTGVPDGAVPLAWDAAGVRFAWKPDDAQVCTAVFSQAGQVGARACAATETTSVVARAGWQDPAAVQIAVDRGRPDLAAITLYRLAGETLVRGETIAATSVAVVPGSARVHLASPDWSSTIEGAYVPTLHVAEGAAFVETSIDDFMAFGSVDGPGEAVSAAWRVAGDALFVVWQGADSAGLQFVRARTIALPFAGEPFLDEACPLTCPPEQRCDYGALLAASCELPNPYFDPHTGRPIVSVRAELPATQGFTTFTVHAQPVTPAGAPVFGAEAVFDTSTGRGTALWMLPEYTTWDLRIEAPGFLPIVFDDVVLPSAGDLVDLGSHTLEVTP